MDIMLMLLAALALGETLRRAATLLDARRGDHQASRALETAGLSLLCQDSRRAR